MAAPKTYVSEMLQNALAEKGVHEGNLKPWARDVKSGLVLDKNSGLKLDTFNGISMS